MNLNDPDFEELRRKYSVAGICAYCPEITFEGKRFCFTGESYRATRAEMTKDVEDLGGSAGVFRIHQDRLSCSRQCRESVLGVFLLWPKN